MDLSAFEVSRERGFLPEPDPLERLGAAGQICEEIAADLPKLLAARAVRRAIPRQPLLEPGQIAAPRELRRVMLLLSFIAHAYVWGEDPPERVLPAAIAVPWVEVAGKLGRPPVLSYASYALDNWRRLDPDGPIDLGNIALLQDFLGGQDEEWFVAVHVAIEAAAGPALTALADATDAARTPDETALAAALSRLAIALGVIVAILVRMPERCDPYIYFRRVRPYIHGWKDNPALPQGLVYDGVTAFGGQPQRFRGETGAQSTILPALDAGLGVRHREDVLSVYLQEMRDYMPPPHRAFLGALERESKVRDAAGRCGPAVRGAYDRCVELAREFRSIHLEYASRYIQQQGLKDSAANPSDVGTGGTPFMSYLKKHRDETGEHAIGRGGQ